MTNDDLEKAVTRIDRLERRLWMTGLLSAVFAIIAIHAITFPAAKAQGQPPVVRARGLIIVDDQGRERILIGAPVPNPKEGTRSSPSTGFVINDPAGYERFGLGLFDDNRVVMGFDAPPGKGDDRNRERINLVADASGGAYLRFLDRKTGVVGRLILDAKDQFYLEFLDFPEGKVVSRRIGFKGEEIVDLGR